MKLKDKYVFRPYSSDFLKMFESEKARIRACLDKGVQIDHIGSTAVPGLGGKGVIDISVVISKRKWPVVLEKLEGLGYEYKKKEVEREKEKLFLMAYLPDEELGTRIYHIHLAYPGSVEYRKEIGFRDYLRVHPRDVEKYAKIKKLAVLAAQNFTTKDEMRDVYNQVKNDFIEQILSKVSLDS